jgi:hypothetical protein
MYNPENPYVLNENYFENTTHVVYKETTAYFIFNTIFNVSAMVSLLSIGLLMFLVIAKTTKSFKSFSHVLFISALADIYVVFGHFLSQTVSLVLAIQNI